MGRVAVVGDVGGHRELLLACLRRLGVTGTDEAPVLPADLTVIQVGDLVHRGPDSPGVLRLVDHFLRTAGGRWVQLVGNHEQLYVERPVFGWPERLDDASVALLRGWWAAGLLRPAAAFEAADGTQWFAAHGGLAAGFWRADLGRPATATEAADRVNALAAAGDDRLWRPGSMLTGVPDWAVGPVWAAAGDELYPSWLHRYDTAAKPPPFAQVHGHSQAAPWSGRAWAPPAAVAEILTVDRHRRQQRCTVGGVPLVGVDPGHGTAGVPRFEPLVVDDARLTTPVPATSA
jgi:hypothetical protein